MGVSRVGESSNIPHHHAAGSVFAQFYQDLNNFILDPSQQNLQKLLGDIQQLQNNSSISNEDHKVLGEIKERAEQFLNYFQIFITIQKELENPALTPQQRAQLEGELQEAENNVGLSEATMKQLAARLA